MKSERNKRRMKHAEYHNIIGYQKIRKKTNADMAKALDISCRTYHDKVKGYSEFTAEQGKVISSILSVSQDELFLT